MKSMKLFFKFDNTHLQIQIDKVQKNKYLKNRFCHKNELFKKNVKIDLFLTKFLKL